MRDALPPELKTSGPVTADAWNQWVRDRDKEIRSRIEGGEAETLTNLLRLGVTYTKEPRISFVGSAELRKEQRGRCRRRKARRRSYPGAGGPTPQ